MLGWVDVVAGASFLSVAVAGWGRSRRYSVVALLAVVAWFAGDLSDPLLLVHRPLVLHVALAYPDGRVRGRFARCLLAVSWAGALAQPLGRHPGFVLPLAGLIAVEAWRLRSSAGWGRRGFAVTSSRAVGVVALSLALPAAVRLWGAPATVADGLIVVYGVLMAVAGVVLLAGLLRSLGQETDAVILLSDGMPGEMLAALRREATVRTDPVARGALDAAVALLASNAVLQAGLADKVEEVRASRARLVEAAISERRRLERIVAEGTLAYFGELADTIQALGECGDGSARQLAAACLDEVARTREDLDQLGRGLHPRVLTDHGLAVALTDLASHSQIPITVDAPTARFPATAETTLWYACAEALANLAKHARATTAAVEIRVGPGEVVARVRDDGTGGARVTPGGGLAGLVDRLGAVGGRLAVEPAVGGGTEVRIWVPLP